MKIGIGDRVLVVDRSSDHYYQLATVTRTAPGSVQSRYWLDFGDGGHGIVVYGTSIRKVVSE